MFGFICESRKELVPIGEFPVAAALPDYLDTDKIGVDVGLVGKIAQLGCFNADVQISAYSGVTTSYDVSVGGMADLNTAFASATGKTTVAHRGEFSSENAPTKNLHRPVDTTKEHDTPVLHAKLNIPEIQQRLQDKNAVLRNPKAWFRELNGGLGECLRGAARSLFVFWLDAIKRGFIVFGTNNSMDCRI